MNEEIWKARFMWLIEQDWVEGECPDNLDISYQDFGEYITNVVEAIDNGIKEDNQNNN